MFLLIFLVYWNWKHIYLCDEVLNVIEKTDIVLINIFNEQNKLP
jgi:hypothetical protein